MPNTAEDDLDAALDDLIAAAAALSAEWDATSRTFLTAKSAMKWADFLVKLIFTLDPDNGALHTQGAMAIMRLSLARRTAPPETMRFEDDPL